MSIHKIYSYGTLRPGNTIAEWAFGTMYDMGWYPAVKLGTEHGPMFAYEVITVDDEGLSRLDMYEGYSPQSPEGSLYIRKPFKDGFIYEYNQELPTHRRVMCGDWLIHRNQKQGASANLAQYAA